MPWVCCAICSADLAIARNKGRTLNQISWRISADRQFRKKNQPCSRGLRALGKFDVLGCIAGEISDGGVDLAEGDLHTFSVKLRAAEGQVAGGVRAKLRTNRHRVAIVYL